MQAILNMLKELVPSSTKKWLHKRFQPRGNYLSPLIYGKATYNQDGLLTVHNADFMREPRFRAAYELGKATGSWDGDLHWRAYVICWAADKARKLEGDYVECGVNRGGFSLTAMTYINFQELSKTFYLLDTFSGLDEALLTEAEKARGIKAGGYAPCYDDVVRTFKDYENVHIIKGTVPDTLPQVKAEKVCYLSIDMNSVRPEIAAVEYFWDKVVSGGVFVLDDYGWRRHIEQKHAFDEFARQKDVLILPLPTGQGLILKP